MNRMHSLTTHELELRRELEERRRLKMQHLTQEQSQLRHHIESGVNAIALNRDSSLLAAAGRSLLKVCSVRTPEDGMPFGSEVYNLRSSNLKNLNFSNNDVHWSPANDSLLATAATNGAVVVWNLMNAGKSKIEHLFSDHKRTVNKVVFHRADPNLILSGSQDGSMKLFDMRTRHSASTFITHSESVRDCQFSPVAYSPFSFASVQETGNIELWDMRRTDRAELNFIAHDGPVFSCEWHPTQDAETKWLATGGRDKVIKIWDLSDRGQPVLKYYMNSIMTVSKLKWRPEYAHHIGSSSLSVDYCVSLWDIQRTFVSYASFKTPMEVTTGFVWQSEEAFITSTKDGTILQHTFENDAIFSAEHYTPVGLDVNPSGDICHSISDFIYRYGPGLPRYGDGGEEDKEEDEVDGKLGVGKIDGTILGQEEEMKAKATSKKAKRKRRRKRRKEEKRHQARLHKASSGAGLTKKMSGMISKSGLARAIMSRSSTSESGMDRAGSAAGRTQSEGESSGLAAGGAEEAPLSSSFSDIDVSLAELKLSELKSKLGGGGKEKRKGGGQMAARTLSAGSGMGTLDTRPAAIMPTMAAERQVTAKLTPTLNFNFKEPIDYRRTPAKILEEHFRSTFSLLLTYKGRDCQGETGQNFLSMRPFVELALHYRTRVKSQQEEEAEAAKEMHEKDIVVDKETANGERKVSTVDSAKAAKEEQLSVELEGGYEEDKKNEEVEEQLTGGQTKTEGNFEEVCEFNAALCDRLEKHQVAQSWRILRSLFSPPGRRKSMANSSVVSAVRRYGHVSGGVVTGDRSERVLSSGGGHPSGGSVVLSAAAAGARTVAPVEEQQVVTSIGGGGVPAAVTSSDIPSRHTSGGGAGRTSHPSGPVVGGPARNENEEDDEEMKEIFDSNKYFLPVIQPTSVASNRFAVDFFDCQEIIDNSAARETLDQESRYELETNYQTWDLQHEAIMHRHNISDFSGPGRFGTGGGGHYPSGEHGALTSAGNQDSPVSYDGDDDDGALVTPAPKGDGMFEENMKNLIGSVNPPQPAWPYGELVASLFKEMINQQGDVQSVVTMMIVLDERMDGVPAEALPRDLIVRWFRLYLGMLAKFELWNVHNQIMRKCHHAEDLMMKNTVDTTILVHCVQCGTALKKANTCRNCRLDSTACCLCCRPVRGLFIWCQGCTHGGHLEHMVEWFQENAFCPTGCGHACEFN